MLQGCRSCWQMLRSHWKGWSATNCRCRRTLKLRRNLYILTAMSVSSIASKLIMCNVEFNPALVATQPQLRTRCILHFHQQYASIILFLNLFAVKNVYYSIFPNRLPKLSIEYKISISDLLPNTVNYCTYCDTHDNYIYLAQFSSSLQISLITLLKLLLFTVFIRLVLIS